MRGVLNISGDCSNPHYIYKNLEFGLNIN
jgi:hypothetical protein